jgi:hypothetical protein
MKADVFLRAVRDANTAAPGTHEIGRPLSPSERARHKRWKLPNDLLGFLKRANGLRFAKGAARLLPLREIRTAAELLYEDQDEEDPTLPSSWLSLTDDVEGGLLLLLDLRARTYLQFDPDDDEAEAVGTTFEEALDWLYARYVALQP